MDGLVEGAPVEGAVSPVVPCILEDEEDCDLVGHLVNGREWDFGTEAEILCHRVEEPGEDCVSIACSIQFLMHEYRLTRSEGARQ